MDLLYFLPEWDFFCGMAGAMVTEIGIPFAGVQVLCGGASGAASEVWV